MATDTAIGTTLCTVASWATGNLGKGIETISIMILGIGALLGKISWGTAILEGAAVAVLFSAAQIVTMLNAGASGCP